MTTRAPDMTPRTAALLTGFGLLAMASLGVFANVLMSSYADYETLFLMLVAVPGIVGELSLMFWLLLRAGKIEPEASRRLQPA